MNVLHLATTYPLHAGDSNAVFVEALAEALAARGHGVDVLVPWHPELQLERPDRRARLHAFRYSPLGAWHPWGYAQALTADRALRWDAYLAAPPAALGAGRRLRRLARSIPADVVHAHWLLPNAPIAAAALRRAPQPFVISCHGSGVFLAERRAWAAALARYALRRCAAVTACSNDLAARADALGAGPPVEWIPYGVAVARFRPLPAEERRQARSRIAARHDLPPGVPWILAVGRLVHKKGFDRLIGALPAVRGAHPGAVALIVGDGPLGPELRRQAVAVGVDEALRLAGAVPNRELPGYYAAADIVAVPSVHGPRGNVDGLPNTLLEGLASGTPVVASRVAGIPDVGRHDDTLVLVPEGDPGALARAIGELLGDAGRRRRIGAAARADAETRLDWDRVAGRFEELYERCLLEARPSRDRRRQRSPQRPSGSQKAPPTGPGGPPPGGPHGT